MARVTCDHPSSFPGYQWPHAGAEVEMDDKDAARLMEIAGPGAGYAVVKPPAKRAAAKAADGES